MEKRLLIAIVLSFVVIFAYQALFIKKVPPPTEPVQEPLPQTEQPLPKEFPETESLPESQVETKPQEKPDFQPVSESVEEKIVVDTTLFRAEWTNRGAVLKSWRLKVYTDENEEPLELVPAQAADLGIYPFALNTDDPEFNAQINTALYRTSPASLVLQDGETGTVSFRFTDENENRVEKTLVFTGGEYTFDIEIKAWKNGRAVETRLSWGPGFGNPSEEEIKRRFGSSPGVAVYAGDKVHRIEEKKYKPETGAFNFVRWAAYEDNYFAALFLTDPQKTSTLFRREEADQTPYFTLTLNHPVRGYIGPKDIDELTEFGGDAKSLIKFGFFGFIAEILLRAIKAIHNAVPNWGFSIIILTILIKIIFFPLTYSSTKSMAKMQELQPKVKALRAKYKKAKQDIALRRKMNEEMMKLYKEHGVNPAGGCLPMLIQLPIFWGFFRMLLISIEFRQSPFMLWINDLSVKDPYYVTPILMGVTQFISQKMTPTSADPTQQRMMLIMPVVMTIFFMNFQSGLVLYWLTNNILQIGQQYIMNRFLHKKKSETHGKKRKK